MACNTIALEALDASCKTSKGGIVEVYIAPYANVSGVTLGTSGETEGMISAITMSGSTKFTKFKFRKNTGSMASNLTIDEGNGVVYVDTELTLLFTRMDTEARTQIQALAIGEVAVIVKDCNKKYWYLGYDEAVMAASGVGQTGTQKTDGNYYQIVLKDTADQYPYEVAESAVEAVI